MKKIFLFLTCLLIAMQVSARHISEEEAFSKAQQFMPDVSFGTTPRAIRGAKDKSDMKSLYIFNAVAKDGFVIVSADDRMPAILGYSRQGTVDTDRMPCGMRWLLNCYESAISALGDATPAKAKSSADRAEIPILIDTRWGQGDPYNALCPLHEGNRCITGCVATAMAQVVNYHRWPQSETSKVASYSTETHGILMSELPQKKFDWNNMGTTAVSQLMLYCGQSVRMDYSSEASGAPSVLVPDALTNVFGYSKSASLVSRSTYSDDRWEQIVYEELSQKRPVLYFGQSAMGGHAFIVDGYTDGMFHLNWGWDGYCDGFFSLDALNPNNDMGFNFGQEIVAGVCPPAEAGDINRPKVIVNKVSCSDRFIERAALSDNFQSFTITSNLQNDMQSDASIQLGLALYDDNGLVKILTDEYKSFSAGEILDSETQVTISSDVPEGEYRLLCVHRMNENEDWITDINSTINYVSVTVTETSLLLQPMPKTDNEQHVIEFGVHTIDGITYRLYSEYDNLRAEVLPYNQTDQYTGDVYIPNTVSYQNMIFNVSECDWWNAFFSSPDLTSLSTSLRYFGGIHNCPNLTKIELREGVISAQSIQECPKLETIEYPSTCSWIEIPKFCENLETIRFRCTRKVDLIAWYDFGAWTKESMPGLKDVFFAGDLPPYVKENDWEDNNTPLTTNENVTIHIPAGSIEVYQKSLWKDWNLVENPNSNPSGSKQINWDYCGNDEYASYGIVMGCGSNDVEFAMRIPADQISEYKNCRITAIEYYTPSPSINDYQHENVEYVFVTTNGTDYLVKQPVTTVRGTWMRVEFNNPYIITGEELFVGIGRNRVLGANWANLDIEEDGLWVRVMGDDDSYRIPGIWSKNAGIKDLNHPLPIRAIIEGDNLPVDVVIANINFVEADNTNKVMSKTPDTKQVSLQNLPDNGYFCYSKGGDGIYSVPMKSATGLQPQKKATADNCKQIKLKLRNRSPRIVREVVLDWDIDGVKQDPLTFETVMLTNHEDVVYADLPQNIPGRNHNLTFTVSTIDGEPDAVAGNSTAGIGYAVEANTHFPRKVVMEEITGTWCGFCPRGIATIEHMKQQYPGNFIAIAVHSDEMLPERYDALLEMVSGFPSARLNRNYWQDLYPFNIDELIDAGEAAIKADAKFTPDKKIEVSTETVFGFSDNGSTEYRIAYVVMEDNVGPYFQSNYYSNPDAEDNPDDFMNWWTHQASLVQMRYDDVARAIYDYYGICGQLPSEIVEGEKYKFSYEIPIPENVQNGQNLKVATLLIDYTTGEILNADCTTVKGESGIDDVRDDTSVLPDKFDIYNLSGILVRRQTSSTEGLPKGLYIINHKKVVVK